MWTRETIDCRRDASLCITITHAESPLAARGRTVSVRVSPRSAGSRRVSTSFRQVAHRTRAAVAGHVPRGAVVALSAHARCHHRQPSPSRSALAITQCRRRDGRCTWPPHERSERTQESRGGGTATTAATRVRAACTRRALPLLRIQRRWRRVCGWITGGWETSAAGRGGASKKSFSFCFVLSRPADSFYLKI
jgi:hypothetical protein